MPGQPQLGTNVILGLDCTAMDVIDPSDPLGPSPLINPAGTPFRVSVKVKFGGLLAPWLMSTVVPFTVTYNYESLGAGPEGTLGTKSGNTVAGKLEYGAPETAADVSLPTKGIYKLACFVVFAGPPVTAFIEGPVIQIQ
jgi:hypothetical protein